MEYGLSSVLRISLCNKRRSLADFSQTVEDAPGARSSSTQRRQLLWLLLSAPVDYVTDDLVSWSSVLSQVSLGTPPLISLADNQRQGKTEGTAQRVPYLFVWQTVVHRSQ